MAMQTVGTVQFDIKNDRLDLLVDAAKAIIALEKQITLAKSELHKAISAKRTETEKVLVELTVNI